MFTWIAHHIRHSRLAPPGIDALVTTLARDRSHIMWLGSRSSRRNYRRLGSQLRNLGQFSDIAYELPDLVIWKIPRGHAGVSNAVLNVIKKLAVRRCCDGRRAKRGRTRIFAGPDGGFSASVIRMADFALRSVKIASCRDVGRISPQRIDSILCFVRNALVQQPGCNHNLDLRRFVEGARKSGNEQ